MFRLRGSDTYHHSTIVKVVMQLDFGNPSSTMTLTIMMRLSISLVIVLHDLPTTMALYPYLWIVGVLGKGEVFKSVEDRTME